MSYILTILLLIMMTRSIMLSDKGHYNKIIWLGFCTRLFLLMVTLTDIIPIPDAHDDAERFNEIALSNQETSMSNWESATNYTFILSVIYYITDCSRWFSQFVNFSFGIYFLIYIRKILCVLDVDYISAKRLLMVAALMPFLNIYSIVLMREEWVNFFVAFSLYYFICWCLQRGNGTRNIILSIVGIMSAMWMHAGIVSILIGYTIAFLTYYREGNEVRLSKSTYAALFLLGVFALILLLNFDAFATKFLVDDISEYATNKSGVERGGSDYLIGIDLSSPLKLLLFLPLKMFYFIYSPIIMDWRGLNDVAAFLMDSLFYIIVTWFAITRKHNNPRFALMKKYLVISILLTIAVFAIGTTNSGTAIRHRAKMSSLMLTLWALSPSQKKNDNHKTKVLVRTAQHDK